MFEQLAKSSGIWLSGSGPEAGIVLSSRIRLARNLAGCKYPSRADEKDRQEAYAKAKAAIQSCAKLNEGEFYEGSEMGELDRQFLVERHLISLEFFRDANHQGLYIGPQEKLSIMVNEEDHLRTQAMSSGLSIEESFALASEVDAALGESLEYDFDPEHGFLTSCPTNVGTGMRASVLIHLPGLVLTGDMDNIIANISKVGLVVRGFYGEGSDVLGNLFQISNQTTLGRSEQDIIESLLKVTRQIIQYENDARQTLVREARDQIEDKIWRALGILKYARVLASNEVMNLLSAVRLGVTAGLIAEVPQKTLNEVLLLSQPAHLQKLLGSEMGANERDRARADLVREKLAEYFG